MIGVRTTGSWLSLFLLDAGAVRRCGLAAYRSKQSRRHESTGKLARFISEGVCCGEVGTIVEGDEHRANPSETTMRATFRVVDATVKSVVALVAVPSAANSTKAAIPRPPSNVSTSAPPGFLNIRTRK